MLACQPSLATGFDTVSTALSLAVGTTFALLGLVIALGGSLSSDSLLYLERPRHD